MDMTSEPKKEAGVLFADISDSSYLFKGFGDEGARDIMKTCLDVMRGVIDAGPGRVVEKIGDELLSVFPTPGSTIEGAIDLQTVLAANRGHALPSFLSIRVGFHFGPVTVEKDSVFGETVYTANRVCSLAKGNQILTTGETVERLPPPVRLRAHFVGERTLKGSNRIREIYRVSWDDPALTATPAEEDASVDEVPEDLPQYTELELTYRDSQVTVSASNPTCLIGRSHRCDIMLRSADVSRVHTRLEYRGGAFFVVDVSSNGTLVRRDDGARVRLQEGEMRLHGAGTIQPSQSEQEEIRFVCVGAVSP
jgi:class 3 adenylate cyclase